MKLLDLINNPRKVKRELATQSKRRKRENRKALRVFKYRKTG